MITQKNEENKPETEEENNEEYRKEFEELPLEKKIASLVELEVIALSETFSFILNSPYEIVGKVMDVMAEFGLKLEDEDKEAKRPKEHKRRAKTERMPMIKAKKRRQNKKRQSKENDKKDDEKSEYR